jgi:two-component system sensor histidine kinase KdpD
MIVDSSGGLLPLYLTTVGDAFRHLASRVRTIYGAIASRLGLPPLSRGGSDDIYNGLSRGLFGAAMALVAVGVATATILIFRDVLPVLNIITIVYLVPVVVAAVRWGIWPATFASVTGALAADYLFYPPLYSFRIDDPQNIADLIVFLIVGLVIGNMAGDLREREREIRDLYGYSKQLAACFTTADLIKATQSYLAKYLGRPTILVASKDVEDEPVAEINVPDSVLRNAIAMRARNEVSAETVYDDATRHAWFVRRVPLGPAEYIVFVDLGAGMVSSKGAMNRRIDAVLTEAAQNLARLDFAMAVDRTQLQAQADALKNALVTTISHDLRSPLVSILGAASVLDQMDEIKRDTRARLLVSTVREQAARLDSDLQNLVDAARITTGVSRPNRQLTDPVDIIYAAIELKRTQLSAHQVKVSIASDVPLVEVQSALVENALAQLLDNAAKYSRAGSIIEIKGSVDHDWVVLSVSDKGVGMTAEERVQVGRQSFRSERNAATISGSGLGLWIAATFIAANGGRLSAESDGSGLGTTMTIYLPATRDRPQR